MKGKPKQPKGKKPLYRVTMGSGYLVDGKTGYYKGDSAWKPVSKGGG